MKTGASLKNRQGGAVAVMVGFSLVLLIGFLAMVIDLGHLYIAKTGLQNAADAAALSGAKELDGKTSAGVTSAKDRAIEAAGMNTFFGDVIGPNIGYQSVILSEGNIKFSDSPYTPDPGWISYSAALNAPGGLYFVKVDTGQQNLHTLFAVIWNTFNMSTYGRAVAGRFTSPITPIGICAIEPGNKQRYEPAPDGYLIEYGFRRGVSYDFNTLNHKLFSGLAPGTQLYLHPTAYNEETCDKSGTSAVSSPPFLCTGQSSLLGLLKVYQDTGFASGPSKAALNTRFAANNSELDSALPKNLDATICKPDQNIKEYKFTDATTVNWMIPQPAEQTINIEVVDWLKDNWGPLPPGPAVRNDSKGCKIGSNGNCNDNYGVLWSYSRPVKKDGTAASKSDWSTLYPNDQTPVGPTAAAAYPGASSPYQDGLNSKSGPYYRGPTNTPSTSPVPRRRLNVVIIECAGGPPNCKNPLTVLGYGKFFMQTKAGNGGEIYAEFDGLVSAADLTSIVRLFQ